MTAANDLTGQVFTRLTVLSRASSTPQGKAMWRCRCECGAEVVTRAELLRRGKTKSCGCYIRDIAPHVRRSHGASSGGKLTPEYKTWLGVRRRCLDEKCVGYQGYGARGVKMHPEWASDYNAFLADVGPKPSPAHSIDRIDPTGNYEPGNVRWILRSAQNRNKRRHLTVTIDGKEMLLIEACERFGADYFVVRSRLQRGWDHYRALTEPVHQHLGRKANR
jgi:hypothetical protein